MASGERKRVSCKDIQMVQFLIENCLQLHKSKQEAVDVILEQAKIEPTFTELVWQKLEEENQEFFRAYHLRLIVKDQILRFNKLLERQDQLMHRTCSTEYSSIPISNESQIPPIQQNTLPHALEHTVSTIKMGDVPQDIDTNFHNLYVGAPSLPSWTLSAVDLSANASATEAPSNIPFMQNSNFGMVQGMNGGMIKPGVYVGNDGVMLNADGNFLNAHPTIANAPVLSSNAVPTSQPLNQKVWDYESSSFGMLGQIPRCFSLSDLTEDFSNRAEILESFSRPVFVGSDHDDFLDPHERGEHQGPSFPP